MSDQDMGKILERVQKLLALSKSTSSPAEAETAMAQAQKLLFKYNLEMADAEVYGTTKEERYTREYGHCMRDDWKRSLYQAVAVGNYCTTIYEPSMGRVAVIGNPANIAITIYSVAWLIPRLETMATSYWSFYPGDEREAQFKDGFLQGAVQGIRNKMRGMVQEQRDAGGSSTALVVRSEEALKLAVKEFYPYTSSGRRQATTSEIGYGVGYKAGSGMSVQPGVETRNSRMLR